MKKHYVWFVLVSLFLTGCTKDGDLGTSSSMPSYDDPYEENIIIPQSFFIDNKVYNLIIDLNHSIYFELDELYGHIIHEDMLEQYNECYPNFIPVIDNQMRNPFTSNMIEIYTLKDMDKAQYLSLKMRVTLSLCN